MKWIYGVIPPSMILHSVLYLVKVLKDGEIVGHIPRLFSKICTLILLSGCSMKVCVSGKRENKRGKGLEVPCLVTVKVSEHIASKVGPIIKGMCKRLISYICFMKIVLFMLFLTVNIRNPIFKKRAV